MPHFRRPLMAALATATLCFLTANTVMAAPSKAEIESRFQSWISLDLWPQAKKAGISQVTFTSAMKTVKLDWSLPDLAPPGFPPPKQRPQSQAEFSSPGPYFREARMQALAASGRALADQYASTLKKIEAKYGVPGPILLALWGRETGYGRAKLPYEAVDVLATSAFMSTRQELFTRELIDALHIIDGKDIAADAMLSSSAGALGQPQFMPSSFLQYAVDFDGDGHRNIWTSVPDSLASMANFLVQKGWQRGRDWGFEVTIPSGVSCAQEGPDLAKPMSAWAATGIGRIGGKAFPKQDLSAPTMMLVPAGTHGPEFLVTPNFYVLKEYNNSDLYALFIGNLADRIAYGSGSFSAPWGDVGHMLRSDVQSMQQTLVKKGYDVGKTDGLAGFKTRRSLGDWQAKNGLKPTCFPDEGLKAKLK
ncbi:lytic murein transglycosylase [Agrobacterium vitis]|uniref:Lytic murein transglycosylase n=1 Tax=Agrobacterium vitis TaxID=373 RepID=A0ABD6G525_AGRVI|nr:lytic murein transglycosylase [Agrobacterium vitis]MUO93929.1 lytic murein transglycosylase [Agrobacterium vitis]MUP03820.1 lytic murein transglycosylase [Agrobacterium vitis]MUZ83308.1 lytic murein transglycosylase [Agrobacterium vitis]MVA10852.1 lytic murein transglycosylase [Agrobacterium vitis]